MWYKIGNLVRFLTDFLAFAKTIIKNGYYFLINNSGNSMHALTILPKYVTILNVVINSQE